MSKNAPTIMIVEDEIMIAQDLSYRLREFGFNYIMQFFNSAEDALAAGTEPDIAILDINLAGKMNGIDLAKKLNEQSKVFVIYLTDRLDETAVSEAAKTEYIAFINKPITNNELRSAMILATKQLAEKGEERQGIAKGEEALTSEGIRKDEDVSIDDGLSKDIIFLRSGIGKIKVHLDNVLYIESYDGGAKFFIEETVQTKNQQYISTKGLKALEEAFTDYRDLVRISRFHVVNLKHIDRIIDGNQNNSNKPSKKLVVGNVQLQIGTGFYKQLKDQLRIF